jgi:hypothetical protein
MRMIGIEDVFGCKLARHGAPDSGAGCDDQRAVRSGKRGAHGLDDAPILLAIRHEIREVVVEGAVDHAVCFFCAAAQVVGVFKSPVMRFGAGADEGLGSCIRPRQADDLVAGIDEFRDDG